MTLCLVFTNTHCLHMSEQGDSSKVTANLTKKLKNYNSDFIHAQRRESGQPHLILVCKLRGNKSIS